MNKALTTEQFIGKAVAVHGTNYSYELTKYVNTYQKIIIKCTRCDETHSRTPKSHLRGAGCHSCDKKAGKFTTGSKKKTQAKFIEEARATHGDRYDYSKAHYTGALDKVTLICGLHGEFEQPADNHIRGAGCHECARQLSASEKIMSQVEFVRKANEVWIFKYDYTKAIYNGMRKKIIVRCPLYGEFSTVARVHLAGHASCSGCQHRGYSDKAMIWIRQIACDDNIDILHAENGGEFAVPGTAYHADGFCAATNTLYEYIEAFWHGDPEVYEDSYWNKITNCTMGELYEKTQKKLTRYKELGYKVIVKWESEDRKFKFHEASEPGLSI